MDVQQILNQSQRGQVLKQKLEQERTGRQKELDGRQQELVKLQAEFEKQAPVLSEQAKREKKESIERRVRDARRVAEDANRDFEKQVREAEMETTREIFAVIQEYGKDQGFSVILERSSMIFSAASVDVTSGRDQTVRRQGGKIGCSRRTGAWRRRRPNGGHSVTGRRGLNEWDAAGALTVW